MADEETRCLLESWGLPADVIEKFQDNDIDFRALKEVKEDDIPNFFTSLGQRLRFRAGLKSLHPVLQPVILGVGSDTSNDNTAREINLSLIDTGPSYNVPSTPSITFETVPQFQSTPVKQVSTSASSPLRSSPRIKARAFKRSLEEPQAKRTWSITSENLEKVLNERVGGKAILNYYKKYGKLNHINQVNLAKYVIDVEWHSSLSKKIETSRFLELRDAIKSLFPTEDPDLFYIPYKNLKNGKKLNARGKLYDQYHELRKILIQSGQIRSNRRRALNFDTDEEINDSQTYDEATNIKFEWLTKSSQPLQQAEKYWKETYNKRIQELEKNNSIAEYYATFPVLKENCGYTFLVSDFSEKFTGYGDTFTAAWPLFKDTFISYIKSKYTLEFLESLQEFSIYINNEGEYESTVAALRLLAFLLPVNKAIKTPNKVLYKPSKLDIVNSMVLVIKSDGDLKNTVAERKAHYAHLKLPFQPITAVVFNGEKISHSYVIIADTEYLLTSPIVAIDVCFKCIFALNAQYPVESKLAWLYMQKNLYEIQTPYDGTYVAVKNLSSAIKDFQKKEENRLL